MIKQVTAFAAEDGQVFPTHGAAARHDAEIKLKAIGIFNHASIGAILEHAPEVCDALNALLDEPVEDPHA